MRRTARIQVCSAGLVLLGTLLLGMSSCGYSPRWGRRMDTDLTPGWPKTNTAFREARLPAVRVAMPVTEGAEYVNDDELCMACHKAYVESFHENVHRGINQGQSCEACHGPASQHVRTRGKEAGTIWSFKKMPPAQAAEVCLKCHEENACTPGAQWRTSKHAHCNVTCTSCHNAHYNVPPGTPATTELAAAATVDPKRVVSLASFQEEPARLPSLRGTSNNLGAVTPLVCYKCHSDMRDLQEIAGHHQIGGPHGFNCTTCHDPHGKIIEHTRKNLCLECHQDAPTMAWHSSVHELANVACTDCHNPHPRSHVAPVLDIQHTHVRRVPRLPMSVDDPNVCYKCHPGIYAKTAMPSHHPIKEGKMVCSDCHDPHGQSQDNLKEASVNMVCYKCHADKQGPFVYEHPPVAENCAICHEPHGTVTNNLLRQPTTFLCLRCHTGHRTGPSGPNHAPLLGDVGTSPGLQRAFYSDCTQCHSQIHGSDFRSPHTPNAMMR